MASAGLEKELDCSICRTLYTDPVTLRCGHNFCRVCIDQVLITQDESGVYCCPECREELQERPALKRNITLCNVVENVRSNQDGKVRCTYCVDSPVPAVRSCLHCEASLCDNHLKDHSEGPEHVLLTEPSASLKNRKCSVHTELLKYYCTEDAACVCVSCCLTGKHSGHKLESLDEAFGKKKETLRKVLQKLITNRGKTERKLQNLEESWRGAQDKASREATRVTDLFIDIRRRVDDLEKRVLSEISRREEQASLSLSDGIQKLEIKKDELSRKIRHIKELCNRTDPLTVLQDPDTGDLCDPAEEGGDEDLGGHDEDVGGHGGGWAAEVITHITHKLSDLVRGVNVTFYVQDPADILLDVNTAHNSLLISDDLKTATWTEVWQSRPPTAQRFHDYEQVVSSRRFTSGRHYWDVEINRSGEWSVGMCYPSIDRRGRHSYIGDNIKSWGLCGGRMYYNQYSVIHERNEMQLRHQISTGRVRICLDYEAGQMSFYELCDPIRHLHTFTAVFTEPLHAALCVCEGSIKILGEQMKDPITIEE
ncbi:E3 ubiquitin/ISG15 ligase TRIM25-like [Phyllobates terribilis]|uniref:E3 ubiquitin/ISG15 ligase TRIM25-like n=1 Tax=Phyllobates terribilis TaxID=111132 RepID=UPI003CCA984F